MIVTMMENSIERKLRKKIELDDLNEQKKERKLNRVRLQNIQ
jgi:hypothetical protein